MKTKLNILIIYLIILSSCSIKKNVTKSVNNSEKDKQKFIYVFSEANNNRLLGNSQKAVEFYMTALDINPQSAASNYYLSSLFFIDKNYNSALTFAKKASKLQPKNLWYNLLEADIVYSKNNVNEALAKYKTLQKQFPYNKLLYDRIIEIILDKIKNSTYKSDDKNTFNELIFIYNEKQKHFGFDSQIAEYLYNIYVEINDTKNTTLTLQKLIKNEPDNPKYKAFLAENYVKSKKIEKADKIYNELNNKYPCNTNVKLSYAKYCKFLGKQNDYFKTVKFLLNSDIKFNDKVHLIISGRHPNFPPSEYEKLLNILQKNHPNEVIANTLLTEFYIKNNKEKALPYLIKATEKSKGDFNLILTLFEVAYDSKNFEILYDQSKKYLQLYPNQAKVYLYNGIGAYKTGRFNKAISVLKIGKDFVIDDNQLLLQFYFYLAETYHSQKENQKSDEQFEKVLSLNSKFYLALNNYSYYLSKRNTNLQKALLMAEVCLNYQPDNPVFNNTYAIVLLKNNQFNKALIYSEKAIKQVPNNIDFLENYGDILFSNNKKEEAIKIWNRSKELGNKSERIVYKIINVNKIKVEDL